MDFVHQLVFLHDCRCIICPNVPRCQQLACFLLLDNDFMEPEHDNIKVRHKHAIAILQILAETAFRPPLDIIRCVDRWKAERERVSVFDPFIADYIHGPNMLIKHLHRRLTQ